MARGDRHRHHSGGARDGWTPADRRGRALRARGMDLTAVRDSSGSCRMARPEEVPRPGALNRGSCCAGAGAARCGCRLGTSACAGGRRKTACPRPGAPVAGASYCMERHQSAPPCGPSAARRSSACRPWYALRCMNCFTPAMATCTRVILFDASDQDSWEAAERFARNPRLACSSVGPYRGTGSCREAQLHGGAILSRGAGAQ